MELVKLTPQRRSGRWNLYFNEGTVLGVSTTLLADFHLRIGQSLTPQQFQRLETASWQEKSYQKALRLLGRRQQSENEIREKLEQYLYRFLPVGKRDIVIKTVIRKLQKQGLINDLEFARWWTTQHLSRGWSRRQLWQELKRKGINKEVISQVLANYQEEQSLRSLLRKKWKQWHNMTNAEKKRKIWLWGRNRGFNSETIEEVIDDVLENR